MKLAITTLGCPAWSFARILENCQAMGLDGIEVRGIEGEMDADKIVYFTEEKKEETLANLAKHNLKLIGFGTSASFHDASKLEANLAKAKTAIDVCARMGIPAIRVFGNNCPNGEGRTETLLRIGNAIRELCRYAEGTGVSVYLEVHGQINSCDTLGPILDICKAEPAFGVLWDVMHSDKTTGDDFEEFYTLIKPYLRHIHLKDYLRSSNPPYKHVKLGRGDIPLCAIIRRVLQDGYTGYFSLEWEKKWCPELDEPEIAFPEFVRFMEQFR